MHLTHRTGHRPYSLGAGSTLCTIYRVSTVHPWRPLKARIRYVRALRLLDLAGFAVFERLPQQHRLLSLCLHLLLQPPQSLDQLLEGGNQQPVGIIEVEQRYVATAVREADI